MSALTGGISLSDHCSFRELLDTALSPEPWCIDHVRFDGSEFEIDGWALAPGGRHSEIAFTLNDRQFDNIEFPIARPDVAQVFWFKPGAENAAFRCRTRANLEDFKNGCVTLKCVDRGTGQPVREQFNWYYPDDRHSPSLPDAGRRLRVAGNESPEIFRLEGYTTFKKLDLALRRTQGKGIGGFDQILDWGCGCGRVTRYFSQLPNVTLTGVDIDFDNLNWCKQELGFGDFYRIPLHPPTELELSRFDLLIGISVFSHLKESDQIEWLYELNRIARPGAVLLMSVLGEATACRSSWDLSLWQAWKQRGIFASGNNDDLQGYIEDDEYYCNTYLTTDYIRGSWSRFFNIVEIIPAYIGNQQDLVILRKPG